MFSSSSKFDFHDSGQLRFPFIAILDQFFLIVEQLLVKEGRILEVGALNDRIDGAGLLAETAENTLGHVDVILCCTARAIRSWLRLDSDRVGRAGSLAQLASNAALLTGRVSAESVLSSEHR